METKRIIARKRHANIRPYQSHDQSSFNYFARLTLALICLSLIVLADNNARGHAAGANDTGSHKKATAAKGPKESEAATKARINAAYGQLPMSFEPNQGQVDRRVEYFSRGQGYTLFLNKGEAVLSLAAGKGKAAAVRMKAVGANINSDVIGEAKQEGRSNYFIGNDRTKWQSDVPHYGKVRYQQVYPGIDLVYYGNQRQLEYDFVVAPGVDPNQIKLRFDGIERMKVDDAGDLVLRLQGGSELRQHRPIVYQEIDGERHEVEGRFDVRGKREVGFKLEDYDQSQPLVIDPTLVYSTFLGGNNYDVGYAIAVDSSGNTYLTGWTSSTDFPTTTGAFQTTSSSPSEVFLSKLNANGTALIYSSYLAGNKDDRAYGVALDDLGCVYITGHTESNDFPTTAGAFKRTLRGPSDAFVTKLNAIGSSLIYSTYLGGDDNDWGNGIAVHENGSAYITGYTLSSNYPTTALSIQTISGGLEDAFVTKLDVTGASLNYSTYLGGSDHDRGQGITVDGNGCAYVTGYTSSTNFPTTLGAYQTTKAGYSDAFVSKINASGFALVYSTFLGGSEPDNGNGIVVDQLGAAYITGDTNSSNYPTTTGAYQATLRGYSDAYVAKFNAAGSALAYSSFLGGTGYDIGYGIAIDTNHIVYLTGETGSSDFPITAGALQATLGGNFDAFVTRLDTTSKELRYSTFLGGNLNDIGLGIKVDDKGDIYLIGETASINFPTTVGAFQTTGVGLYSDAFVAKFSKKVLPPEIRKMFGASSLIVGQQTTLTFSITNPNTIGTLTGIGFVDNLPTGLIVASPASIVGSCGPKTTIVPGGSLISLADATLAPGTTCNFRTTVEATTPGMKNNITTAVTSNEAGDGNQATASLDVKALPPTLAKSFLAPSVPLNGQTSVIFELKNPNPTATLTQVSFSDPLPAGMRVAKTSSGFGCSPGSSLTAIAGSSTITYANGTLLPGESCRMFVTIEGIVAGSWSNTTTAIDSLEGGRGSRGFAVLDVIAPPRLELALSGSTMKVGVRGMFTIVITNPNSHAWVTGVGVNVTLPLGLQVAPGATGCGGILTATPGSRGVSLSGAAVSPGAVCQLRIPIDATRSGLQTIQSTNIVSGNGGTGNSAGLPVLVKPASGPF